MWERVRKGPAMVAGLFALAILSVGFLDWRAEAQVASDDTIRVPSGGFVSLSLDRANAGDVYAATVRTDGTPVDLLFLNDSNFRQYLHGQPFQYLSPPTAFHIVDHATGFNAPGGDAWYLVLDNTHSPIGGAPAARAVAVRLHVEVETGGGTIPFSARDDAEAGTITSALTMRAAFWELVPGIGVTGLTLWMLALAGVAWPRKRRVLAWTGILTWGSFIFSYVEGGNVVIYVAVPAAFGLFIGHMAANATGNFWDGLKATYFSTFTGILVGADLLSLLYRQALTGMDGVAVIGGAGMMDALVVAPAAATAWYVASTVALPRIGFPAFLSAQRTDAGNDSR